MAQVNRIGQSDAQIDYRLDDGFGCETDEQLDYRSDDRERPLRWVGSGLAAVGIEAGAELTEADKDKARALMRGVHPQTGEQLVTPKLAVCDDAKVELEPLVRAVRDQAVRAGVRAESFFQGKQLQEWNSAARAIDRLGTGHQHRTDRGDEAAPALPGPTRRADRAGTLADAAGIDANEIWGPAYAEAVRNLTEVQVTEDDGGMVRTELVPRRRQVGTAGYDMTFTLPKSFSLLMAFSDDRLADRIEGIYSQGVVDTFGWIESQTAYQMRGHHGNGHTARVEPTEGYLGWTMVHRSARPTDPALPAGDPHWHIHATIANLGRADDGKWATVAAGGRDLMRHIPAADKVLQALVRHELTEQVGAHFVANERTGLWELAGFNDAVISQFSKRGNSIAQELERRGFDLSHTGAKRVAGQDTRLPKAELTGADDQTLRSYWLAEASRAGLDVQAMARDSIGGETAAGEPTEVEKIRVALADPDTGLTAHRRRFNKLDAIAAVAEQLPHGARTVEDLVQLTEVVLSDTRLFPTVAEVGERLDSRIKDPGALDHAHLSSSTLFTTADVIEAEGQIAAYAVAEDGRATATTDQVTRAVSQVERERGHTLGEDQVDAIRRVVTSPAPLDTIIGPPGTGKTTMLAAARAAWEAADLTVMGAATGAKAARGLQVESGIASHTIAQLLARDRTSGDPLQSVDVLVIDEASLTDDRARARLYQLAESAHTKVVEVGDPKQLRGVGVGSSFGVVHQALGGPELTHNRRQLDPADRHDLAAWRDGHYRKALESLYARGRLRVYETSEEAGVAMAAEWQRQRAGATPTELTRDLLVLSPTNEGVRQFNQAAQQLRHQAGELGPLHPYLGPHGDTVYFGTGDLVVFRENDRDQDRHTGPDLINGIPATITHTNRTGVTVHWQATDDDGTTKTHQATISPAYIAAGGLELGYALTAHRGQGMTVTGDRTRADGSRHRGTTLIDLSNPDAATSYVGLSRHRGDVIAYVALDQLETPDQTADRGPITDQADLTRRALTEMLAKVEATTDNINDQPASTRLRTFVHHATREAVRPSRQLDPTPGQQPPGQQPPGQHQQQPPAAGRQASSPERDGWRPIDQRNPAMAEYYDYRDQYRTTLERTQEQTPAEETRTDRLRRFAEPETAGRDQRDAERVDRLRQYADPDAATVHRDERSEERAGAAEERYEHAVGEAEYRNQQDRATGDREL